MDYEAIGLKAGLEIHQQLDTEEKLFCHCPTVLRDIKERNSEFHRFLRATVSELGEMDRAAEEEMMAQRRFTYYAYDTTCLVEDDEEPPAPLNNEALEIALTIAKLFGMTPVEEVHTMRKLVIDGSNTTGFQRTALVALHGRLPGGCRLDSICLEEEAAQRVDDRTFSLDRLGIPLVEISTAPCLRTPEEVQEVAEYIGMVLRSTGRVKRGIGTIRQDINISIRGGARVEIKGVQELDLIADAVKGEVKRQLALLAIKDELLSRRAAVMEEFRDVTPLFSETGSKILKKAPCILAVFLQEFGGLVGREIQPGRRLGSELADYAKKCGVGGIFHTDELPAYGISEGEISRLRVELRASEGDCIVLVAGERERAECAARQVMKRAKLALVGIPEETRRMLGEGESTAYLRPLPGAARMYPETDVFPVRLTPPEWEAIEVPELLSVRAERFVRDLGLDPAVARQIAYSDRIGLFEAAVSEGIRPSVAARTLASTLRELKRDGIKVDGIGDREILELFRMVESGRLAKEAIPSVLKSMAGGKSLEDAIQEVAPPMTEEGLEALIDRIVRERESFVRERGRRALGPLMGVVMAEARGRVDGKVIASMLGRAIDRITGGDERRLNTEGKRIDENA
ncbi:MAG: Glu-tRNA(Gln) amidotransferase subunit GatE [Methanomicrobiales archaeon]|nr:Glu-tRNA(Gln) amidotransferase subunit GatE [Methanomicrobiales archaeon]